MKDEKMPAFQNKAAELIITERKKFEEQQSLFASIVNSSDDAIISKTMAGKIISWNPGAEKIFGYSAPEIIGKDISILVPPHLLVDEKEIIRKIRNGEKVEHYETQRIRKDGEVRHVSITISPIRDSIGNIIGASKILRDTTELKKGEAEKEKRAAELIVANKELAFQNEEKDKRAAELVLANKELAFQNEQKEHRAAELLIANKELAFQNDEKEKRAAELIVANKELAFQNVEKDKRAAELILANKELQFQNGQKEKRAIELTLAYSELKKAEEQLMAVNKELEAFSYSVSHDLRAPLRAILGYTQILREDYSKELNSDADRVMSSIVKNAKKMGQLVDDLLAFSRLGRKELQVHDIKMNEMVDSVCDELKGGQENRQIEFDVKELLPARADNIAIRQVWLNLLSNAIKYSKLKKKALIEIGSEIKGTEIIYHVKDNGAGFDMRYADKLFGVFQRLHSDEEFEGNGVGLAIVQRLVAKHGGRVWAEGKVNEGATFYFSLIKN